MKLGKPFSYLEHFDDLLTSYNEGQKENSENVNAAWVGVPRSGKGQVSGWLKEHGLAGEHIKLFETHAASTEHLEEIFQFMLPNGYLLNRKSKKMVDNSDEPKGIIQIMEQGRYKDPDTSVSDLEDFVEVCNSERPGKRIEFIDELIEDEGNHSLRERLKKVREKQVEIRERLDQIRGCYNRDNKELPNLPDTFQENYIGKKNRGFNVEVFTPISESMPTCEVPEFFEPFAIPVDAYKKYDDLEHGLKIIHSEKFKQYKGLYQRAVRVGDTSFQDLRSVENLKGKDYKVKREYGDGKEWEDVRVRNEENIKEKFKRDWNDMFFPIGVVCSSDFDYKLRSRLKEAVLDDDVDIVTLYTGFLGNEATKKFVMVYFIETLFDIVRNLSGNELRKLDRQFIASMIEAQGVIKQSNRRLKNVDRVFNGIMRKSMNNSGHYNFAFWFDVKPGDAHRLMKSKVPNKVVTKVEEDVKDWCSKNLDGKKDLVKDAFSDELDYGSLDGSYPEFGYGFLYSGTGDVEWEDKHGRKRYGHRLPCPRMCVQDPVDLFSKNDWSFFLDELGFDSMSFEPFMDALFQDDWMENAGPHIESAKKEKEEEERKEQEEELEKKEMLKETVWSKMETKVKELDEEPSSWTALANEILDELHDKGMAGEWEHPRNVMDATEDMRKNFDKYFNFGADIGGIDVYELKDELKELESNGVPVFLNENLPSKEKKMRLAKRYILENYDVDKEGAERLAEEATDEAITDLQMDGVINNNLKPINEYEEDVENYWSYLGSEPDTTHLEGGSEVDEEEDEDVDIEDSAGSQDQEDGADKSSDDVEPVADSIEDLEQDEEEGESDVVEPDGPWSCSCGQYNQEGRTVCGNPKCLKSYGEVVDGGEV